MSINAIFVAFISVVAILVLLRIASIIKAQFISKKIVVTPKRRIISPSLTPVIRNTNHLSLVPTDEDLAIHIPVNHLKKTKVGFDWPDKYSRHS